MRWLVGTALALTAATWAVLSAAGCTTLLSIEEGTLQPEDGFTNDDTKSDEDSSVIDVGVDASGSSDSSLVDTNLEGAPDTRGQDVTDTAVDTTPGDGDPGLDAALCTACVAENLIGTSSSSAGSFTVDVCRTPGSTISGRTSCLIELDLSTAAITYGNLGADIHGSGTIPVRVLYVDAHVRSPSADAYYVVGTPSACVPSAVGFTPLAVTITIPGKHGPPFPVAGCTKFEASTIDVVLDPSQVQRCGTALVSSIDNLVSSLVVGQIIGEIRSALNGGPCAK